MPGTDARHQGSEVLCPCHYDRGRDVQTATPRLRDPMACATEPQGCVPGSCESGQIPPPASRKEVIQPQVPLRLPCYDFTPVADLTVVGCLLTVGAPPSGKANSHGVTGGVYKARERIHRGMLIRDY